jgi:hypothetical protein
MLVPFSFLSVGLSPKDETSKLCTTLSFSNVLQESYLVFVFLSFHNKVSLYRTEELYTSDGKKKWKTIR